MHQQQQLVPKLTPAELARELNCSLKTLARWRRLRIGPAWGRSVEGGRIFYLAEDVEAYLKAQRTVRVQ
ncbi:helix-turn-helix domain-containing protein [Lysobacter sp. A6]|uniref:Helix-turn-helix domain-containing protein n=1 Tax=Noviluteimonas lactosilytica TaxID=2888523 RepID=A0ABS8JLK2_9GAMM|nr:helix-turn-helix domain-containing protein [Lysobacter lactosilyticus]MCC8364493.1 helix-turn-helix domain-containing protein [Lysobacter lactosilyticus]